MASERALAPALAELYRRVPLGMRLGLEPMRAACARNGHPEGAFAAVHVAGTNGKGSVCAMVESVARAAGLHTGLYTSPHLCRFAERIRIDGEPIDDSTLATHLMRALKDAARLSFFEAATLSAFFAFREANVDIAIVEVGLGGRLDATNVLPRASGAAITRIALDHTDRLGQTLVDIAREKAGIAKPGLDIVLGPMPDEVRAAIDEVARSAGATTSSTDGAPIPTAIGLAGNHQVDNARIASVLSSRLGASRAAIEKGIAGVVWPGRLERIGPYLLDAAHNADGAEALARYVATLGYQPEEVALVFGTLIDKDYKAMLTALAPLAANRVYIAPHAAARPAVDPQVLRSIFPGTVAESVPEALAILSPAGAAASGAPESRSSGRGAAGEERPSSPPPQLATDLKRELKCVVICGSIVAVGQARADLLGLPRDLPVAL
jgi:dihydrofolate synthase / folylpolyglutamate synthase